VAFIRDEKHMAALAGTESERVSKIPNTRFPVATYRSLRSSCSKAFLSRFTATNLAMPLRQRVEREEKVEITTDLVLPSTA